MSQARDNERRCWQLWCVPIDGRALGYRLGEPFVGFEEEADYERYLAQYGRGKPAAHRIEVRRVPIAELPDPLS